MCPFCSFMDGSCWGLLWEVRTFPWPGCFCKCSRAPEIHPILTFFLSPPCSTCSATDVEEALMGSWLCGGTRTSLLGGWEAALASSRPGPHARLFPCVPSLLSSPEMAPDRPVLARGGTSALTMPLADRPSAHLRGCLRATQQPSRELVFGAWGLVRNKLERLLPSEKQLCMKLGHTLLAVFLECFWVWALLSLLTSSCSLECGPLCVCVCVCVCVSVLVCGCACV